MKWLENLYRCYIWTFIQTLLSSAQDNNRSNQSEMSSVSNISDTRQIISIRKKNLSASVIFFYHCWRLTYIIHVRSYNDPFYFFSLFAWCIAYIGKMFEMCKHQRVLSIQNNYCSLFRKVLSVTDRGVVNISTYTRTDLNPIIQEKR